MDGGRNASAWVCCLLDNVASKAASLSATINNSRRYVPSSSNREQLSSSCVHGVFRPRCEHGGIGVRTWTGWARSVRIYELGPLKEIALESWEGEKKGTGGGEMGGSRSNAV